MSNTYVAIPNIHALRDWLIQRVREDFHDTIAEDAEALDDILVWGHKGIGKMDYGELYRTLLERDLVDEAKEANLIATEADYDEAKELFLDIKVGEAMDNPEFHLRKLYENFVVRDRSVSAFLSELDEEVWKDFIEKQNEEET